MKFIKILKMSCIGLMTTITLTSCPSSSDSDTIVPDPVTPKPNTPGSNTPESSSGKTYDQDITVSAEGENKDITLYNLSGKIASIEYSSSWLTVVSNTYSSGAPSVHLNVEKNTSSTSRTCNVTITTSGSKDKQILHIKQDAIQSGIGDIHNEKTDSAAYSKSAY